MKSASVAVRLGGVACCSASKCGTMQGLMCLPHAEPSPTRVHYPHEEQDCKD